MDFYNFYTNFITIVCLPYICNGYIWNLAWSSAVQDDGDYPHGSNHPKNIHRPRGWHDDRENNRVKTDIHAMPCLNDRSCGRGKFCDEHYGTCETHRNAGEACRRDRHCQKGYDCMFGKCQKTIAPSLIGARCKHDRDCGSSMCCARQHGEKICKAKLKLGQRCYVPKGGLDYSLNELCPCDTGMVCKNDRKGKRTRDNEFSWKSWSSEHMRCSTP